MFRRILSLWQRLVRGGGEAPREEQGVFSEEEDRRVWVRHPSTAQAVVQSVRNGIDPRLSARVRNVSRGGINLLLDRPLQPGDMISIELPGSTPEKTSTVLACVVHVCEQGPNEWSAGCTFSESLSDPALETFGARRQKPAQADDHRSWVRFPCNVEASCQRIDHSEGERWDARVVNISAAGIGLVLDRPVENGTLMNLDLRSPTTRSTRTILACVVHVTSRPGEWNVGCNFIRELSDSDLAAKRRCGTQPLDDLDRVGYCRTRSPIPDLRESQTWLTCVPRPAALPLSPATPRNLPTCTPSSRCPVSSAPTAN